MKRYQLSEYFERGRREEGITREQVESTVHAIGERRPGSSILPYLLLLLLITGVVTWLLAGDGDRPGTLTGETSAPGRVKGSPAALLPEKELAGVVDTASVTPADATEEGWGYRMKPGSRFRYRRDVYFNEKDFRRIRDYSEWADILVERVDEQGNLTLHLTITNEERDTLKIIRATISPLGDLHHASMIYDEKEIEWQQKIMEPTFGGGMRPLPSRIAQTTLDDWIPIWQRKADFTDGSGTFETEETRYDTSGIGRSIDVSDFDDPGLHGDTIDRAIFYSSAKSRGISKAKALGRKKKKDPGAAESLIEMVPIITAGTPEEREHWDIRIDTTFESHTYRLIDTISTRLTGWLDIQMVERVGSVVWEDESTLLFHNHNGVLQEWTSKGTSRGHRDIKGMNNVSRIRVRLVGGSTLPTEGLR